jgi:Tfp pilus tip-associated adhesin PilY1
VAEHARAGHQLIPSPIFVSFFIHGGAMLQRGFKSLFLTLLACAGTGLFAQLDTRLQQGKTDFMDLYQSTGSKKTKPEIVTVLDFSGSMLRMMFHPGFPNNADDEDTTNTTSDYRNLQVLLTGSAPNINATVTWSSGTAVANTITVSGTNVYTFNAASAPYAPTNATTQYKQLIRPDGTPVTYAIANTINGPNTPNGNLSSLPAMGLATPATDARNWVRAASHVRMSMIDPDNGGVLRTVDIPINWAVLGQYDSTGAWLAPTLTNPLSRATVTNTDGTVLDIDATYRGTDGTNTFLRTNGGASKAIIGASSGSTQSYRTRYIEWIFRAKDSTGAYLIPDAVASYKAVDPTWWDDTTKTKTYITAPRTAFDNKLPNRARVQALKEAFLKTWIKYQNDVLWAWRTLADDGTSPSNDTGTQPTGLTEANLDGDNATYSGSYSRTGARNWFLMNKDSLGGMRMLSKMFATNSTPLVVSQIGAYTQLQNVNPFASYETTVLKNSPSECMRIFCLMFTDGTPTAGGIQTAAEAVIQQPYSNGAAAGNNAVVAAGLNSLNSGGNFANMSTFAGVAAHLGTKILASSWVDPKGKTYPSPSGTPSAFAPWYVKTRGSGADAFTFNSARPIQTMTIGMSLGSSYSGTYSVWKPDTLTLDPIATTPDTPKYRLLASAVYGDPDKVDYNIATATPYEASSDGTPTPNSSYYFDAISAKKLVDSLDTAFGKIKSLAAQSVTATPVAPFSGLALAKQIYLGSFEVPSTPSPLWVGDLMMFPTRTVNNQTMILATDGSQLTQIDTTTAATQSQWSAKKILNTAGFWTTRKVYTRAVATSTNKNPGLSEFTDTTGTGKFDDFKNNLPAGTDADRQKLVRWMRGADAYNTTNPTGQRSNLMGDIINSTPTALEYATNGSLPSTLATALGDHPGARFRLVFAGTNDGYFHAFGEVTWEEKITTGAGESFTMTKGTATELWSFIPTDVLPNMAYLQAPGNPHRFTVDGAPLVYHLDLPPSGKLAGNGKVDSGERAVVVFGLRKGGRSFYALDVSDPLNPKMAWALRAEEASVVATDAARNLSSTPLVGTTNSGAIQDIVDRMGFATAMPALGRVLFTDSGSLRARDAVFLGGGLSVPEVEAQFLDASSKPKKLGRSVMALDVYTGQFLRVWDLTNVSGMGPVPAGVVPHQFFPSSGLVQRAYFTDMAGGLWALGSGFLTTAAPNAGIRMDTSELDRWTVDGSRTGAQSVRHVYQGPAKELHSTLPAPFNLGNFPVYRTTDPQIAPSAVGIAFVSGDRNNPLDLNYTASTIPTGHRLNVVFDRQDSYLLGVDVTGIQTGQMENMTSQTSTSASIIDPGSNSYYLRSKYGYYINFPGPFVLNGSTFIPKGVNEPTVLAGVLFYTYFKPTSGDPCNPGAGLSRSWRVCDVINPVVSDNAAPVGTPTGACTAGFVMEWAGVASNFGAKSTVAVTQAGGVLKSGAGGASGTGEGTGKVAIGTATGSLSEAYPKPRVWRSVHSNL